MFDFDIRHSFCSYCYSFQTSVASLQSNQSTSTINRNEIKGRQSVPVTSNRVRSKSTDLPSSTLRSMSLGNKQNMQSANHIRARSTSTSAGSATSSMMMRDLETSQNTMANAKMSKQHIHGNANRQVNSFTPYFTQLAKK